MRQLEYIGYIIPMYRLFNDFVLVIEYIRGSRAKYSYETARTSKTLIIEYG